MSATTQISPLRSPVTLPTDNPSERLGQPLPAEGEAGVFTQSWFPICLAEEVRSGQVRGEAFLDGKVVVYRSEEGVATVVSAYCPHLGSDLSVGCVVGDRIRCAFHQWEFDGVGRCVKTGIGDPAPNIARLFKFPTQERFGIIWAFNGNEPLWDLPDFEYPDEDLAIRVYRYAEPFRCDPWVFAANTPDMQHIKVVHKVEFAATDPHAAVSWDKWGFRYKIIAAHQGGVPIEWTLGIRGSSLFWQEGPYGDIWLGGMVGFALPRPGIHQVFAVLALRRSSGTEQERERLEAAFGIAEGLMYRTIFEDKDILNSIHYHPGALTKGDTTLARYLEFLRRYPRAHPSGPFIK